jgi:hypothetical protein
MFDQPISTTPRNADMITTSTITTTVEPMVCLRDGHVTFLSSILTSLKNWIDLSSQPIFSLQGAVRPTPDAFEGNGLRFVSPEKPVMAPDF